MKWSAVYDTFGNCSIDVEAIENNLRFAGQYYDAETGLHYNWNRYYDPETGRYMRVDPVGEGLNLYLYVQNNPLKYVDPRGLTAVKPKTSFWGNVGQFGLGVADSFVDTYQGLKTLATTNPVDTAKNIYNAASNPVQTFNSIKDGYVEKSKSARGIGSIFGEVLQTVATGGAAKVALKGVTTLAKTSKLVPKSASQTARSFQGGGLYPGVDRFRDITLQKGKVIYGGAPGQSAFYTTESGLARAAGSRSTLSQGLQVAPNPTLGHRPGVTAYEVLKDTPSAFGKASANPQHGAGGLPQLVVPDYENVLRPIYSVPLGK